MKKMDGADFIQPFGRNRLLQGLLLGYAVLWSVMAIEPYSRFNWFLENLLIFAAVLVAVGTYSRFVFSNLSYALTTVFIALHTIGAHYSYSATPVDAWLHELLHFERNSYDRIVHFSYGLLLAYPMKELIARMIAPKGGWACVLSPVVVLASGAFYELIEMWVALIVAPEIGTLFLGTQGDPWDTQHDMELALYGAMITMLITAVAGIWRENRKPNCKPVQAGGS
jgi:putative membrane protein